MIAGGVRGETGLVREEVDGVVEPGGARTRQTSPIVNCLQVSPQRAWVSWGSQDDQPKL